MRLRLTNPPYELLQRARALARRSCDGDDDAFGRGTQKAGVGAQIETGLIRFKARKEHRRLAVRTERTFAGSFSMEERGDGTIEHNTLPLVGRERNALSVTDRRRDGAVMVPPCASGFPRPWAISLTFKDFD